MILFVLLLHVLVDAVGILIELLGCVLALLLDRPLRVLVRVHVLDVDLLLDYVLRVLLDHVVQVLPRFLRLSRDLLARKLRECSPASAKRVATGAMARGWGTMNAVARFMYSPMLLGSIPARRRARCRRHAAPASALARAGRLPLCPRGWLGTGGAAWAGGRAH